MTQNLDLCIGCTGTEALTSENTDLTTYSTTASDAYGSNGSYSKFGDIITWTPSSAAYTSAHTVSGNTVSPAMSTSASNSPESAEGGDTYIYIRKH